MASVMGPFGQALKSLQYVGVVMMDIDPGAVKGQAAWAVTATRAAVSRTRGRVMSRVYAHYGARHGAKPNSVV